MLELSRKAHNAKTSVEYADQAIELADSLKLMISKAKALHQSGIALKNFGDFVRSADRLNEAEEIYRENRLPTERYRVLLSLGETYRAGEAYDMAMSALQEAKAYFRSINNTEELARTYNRLAATAHEVLGNRSFFAESSIEQNIVDHRQFMQELYKREDLYKEYLTLQGYLDTAMLLAKKIDNKSLIFSNKNIAITLSVLLYDNDGAIAGYNELLSTIRSSDDQRELPLILINKARLMGHFRMNNPHRAIELSTEALRLAEKENVLIYVLLANLVLHENYYAIGDYQKAYSHLYAREHLREKFQSDIMRLNATTNQLEYQIKLSEYDLQNRRAQTRLALISGMVLFVMFTLFILLVVRKNKKLRLLLRKVNDQNATISTQNEELSNLNGEKDRLFHIIAHDLRSPFNTISSFSDIIHNEGDSLTPEDLRQYTGLIHYTAERTLQLLESLLHWARIQIGSETFQPEKHQLHRLVDIGITPLIASAEEKGIRIHNQVPEEILLFCDEKMIVTVARNLVSNGIKFSHSDGEVFIQAVQEKKEVVISVRDCGIGIPATSLDKLFRSDTGFSTPGTSDEPGTGFGLVLCKALVHKHKGSISVESEEGTGSVFTIHMPLLPQQ